MNTTQWHNSRAISSSGECVEIAAFMDGAIALRCSGDPDGFWMLLGQQEMRDFLAGAKAGDFDHLVEDQPGM